MLSQYSDLDLVFVKDLFVKDSLEDEVQSMWL